MLSHTRNSSRPQHGDSHSCKSRLGTRLNGVAIEAGGPAVEREMYPRGAEHRLPQPVPDIQEGAGHHTWT